MSAVFDLLCRKVNSAKFIVHFMQGIRF